MLDRPPPQPAADPQPAPASVPLVPDAADIVAILGRGRSRGARRRWLLAAGIVVMVVLAGLWWSLRSGESAVTYATGPATRGALVVSVTAAGTIEPINQVDVSSELSGTIGSVEVDFNAPVKAGETLATLKTDKLAANVAQGQATLAAREADLAGAKASAAQAAAALARSKQLRATGGVTEEALGAAQSASDVAAAALAAAEANRQIAVANLSIAQSDLGKATIVSPIDGVVLSRNIDVGQTVAASLSAPVLFTLAEDLRKMQLEVDVDEADVGKVAAGDRATFSVAAYGDRTFPATVAQVRFAPTKIEGVVTYTAILSVDNSDLLLRPGMTATSAIVVADVVNALTVPNAALRFTPPARTGRPGGILALFRPPPPPAPPPVIGPGEHTVWVLRAGTPVPVTVTTGMSDGTRTEVTGGALAEGDTVITAARTAP